MKQIKKGITFADLTLDYFDGDTFDDFIEFVQDFKKSVSKNFPQYSNIKITLRTGDYYTYIQVWGDRLETDEECQERINKHLHSKELKRKQKYLKDLQEKRLYLKLKEKYENECN